MSLAEMLGFAARALLGHRLRTGLSLVGMIIGVSAVMVLTALGEGARLYVTGQFADIGANLLILVPGKSETTGMLPGLTGAPNDLTLEDAEAIGRQVSGVTRVSPLVMANETVAAGERRRQVAVMGTTREYFEIRNLKASLGEILPAGEWSRGQPVAILGKDVAKDLFPGRSPLGEVIRIGSFRMRVIGVLEPKGTQIGVNFDELVIVPVSVTMKMFNRSSLFRIIAHVATPGEIEPAKKRTVALLTERHGEEDITVLTQDSVLDTLSAILGALTMALGGIGAISLSVAGLGIMNVMLVSVSERTGEVGLLKALGAKNPQILGVFLAEAALLSSLGGALGLLVGFAITRIVGLVFPALSASPPWWAVAGAFATSLLVGLVFGVLPARRAMKLDPVAALGRG
jgi:putative ABC transport system permease protein